MDELKQYAAIRKQIKVLESQLEEIKPIVIETIFASGQKFLETDEGTFVVKERRTFDYPLLIKNLDTQLKKMKEVYENSPQAVIKNVTSFPTFIEKGGKLNG